MMRVSTIQPQFGRVYSLAIKREGSAFFEEAAEGLVAPKPPVIHDDGTFAHSGQTDEVLTGLDGILAQTGESNYRLVANPELGRNSDVYVLTNTGTPDKDEHANTPEKWAYYAQAAHHLDLCWNGRQLQLHRNEATIS